MLLRNGYVLQTDETKVFFERLDIRTEDGEILDLGTDLSQIQDEEIVDLNGDIVLPGMVNSHYHSYTNILRGTSFGEPLELWSNDTVALGEILNKRDMELSASLGIIEMLRAGVTACVDHIPHLDKAASIARVYSSTGFKAGLAPMLHNIKDSDLLYSMDREIQKTKSPSPFPSTDEYLHFYRDFIASFNRPNENTRVMVGINSPQRADDELLEASSQLARDFDLPVHSHLLESRWQRLTADHTHSPVEKMDQYGLLTKRASLAHCVWLKDFELELLAQKGATAITNPTSNHFLGSGVFPAKVFIERGIPIALGSDGVNCGTNHNMLEILRFFLLLERNSNPDYGNWIGLKKGYDIITRNGSSLLNFSKPAGQISKNHAADLVVVDRTQLLDILDSSLAAQLIFNTSHLDVKHVLINGQFVMKDREILGLSETEIRGEISERKRALEEPMKRALERASRDKEPFQRMYGRLQDKFNEYKD